MSLPPSFAVGDRVIGGAGPTYVIAEAGSNHNRDLGIAKALIDVAAESGADAVKFQTYSGNRIYSRKAESKFLKQWTDKTPAELLEDISLPREWHAELAGHARARGIDFFSAPFDDDAVSASSCYVMPVTLEQEGQQGDVRRDMLERGGVQTSTLYPAIHEFSAYQGESRGDLPRAERFARTEVTLPLHPYLTESEQDRVVASLEAALS